MSSLFGGQQRTPALNPADALARKEQIMSEVKNQLAVANAQQLISTMNDKCYARCILKPGPALTPSDEGCISRCSDRFLEACPFLALPALNLALIQRRSRSHLQDVHQEDSARTGGQQYLK